MEMGVRTEGADAVSVLGLTSDGFVAAAEVRISRDIHEI